MVCYFSKCEKTDFLVSLVNLFLRQILQQFRCLWSNMTPFLFLSTHTYLDVYVHLFKLYDSYTV